MSKHNKSVKKLRAALKKTDLASLKIQELDKRIEELETSKNKQEEIKAVESFIKLLPFGKMLYDLFTDP